LYKGESLVDRRPMDKIIIKGAMEQSHTMLTLTRDLRSRSQRAHVRDK